MISGQTEWSEAELVRGLLLHDRRAWTLFLRRYDGVIYAAIDRILRGFPGIGRSVEREEIYATLLSELIARDMQKLRAFDAERGTRLTTWMSMLATNASWDYLRGVARRRQQALEADADAVQALGPSPLAALLAREDCSRVRQALSRMTARDRQFVELFLLHSHGVEEIAAAMRISVKTVYTKRHKVKRRLERALRV